LVADIEIHLVLHWCWLTTLCVGPAWVERSFPQRTVLSYGHSVFDGDAVRGRDLMVAAHVSDSVGRTDQKMTIRLIARAPSPAGASPRWSAAPPAARQRLGTAIRWSVRARRGHGHDWMLGQRSSRLLVLAWGAA